MKPTALLMWKSGVIWCAIVLTLPAAAADDHAAKPAKLSVRGMGWWGNREQRVALERVLGEHRGELIDGHAIEDAAFMIISALAADGFLRPAVEARITMTDGSVRSARFDSALDTLLPVGLEAKAVRFDVSRGLRSVIHEVSFTGLNAIKENEARGFFRPNDVPLVGNEARAYAPARLRRSAESLQDTLRQRGYAEALVRAQVINDDPGTGHVNIRVEVDEGPRWMIRSVRLVGGERLDVDADLEKLRAKGPWSHHWQQDAIERVRHEFYRRGYADVQIRTEPSAAEAINGVRAVDVTLLVSPGPEVRVGAVRFEGNNHTDEAVLRDRVNAGTGDVLNPLIMDRARFRIARLGAFETVDLRYEPPTGNVRDAVFTVEELPRWDASLLAGYGSYEQLRGGVELEQPNLFGRAHQSRLTLVQSFKSSRGEYTYTVPELFGESVDGTARVFGLRREEESFVRQEYGGTVGVRRRIPWINAEGRLGYTYQSLSNQENTLTTSAFDAENVRVASIDVGLTRDRRDNPLRPRRGYRWFAQAELASASLGGEVDYQAFETGIAYHTPWGRSRWVHVGLSHGAITRVGAPDGQLIPVNRRFYPGGDNSIRGYQKDEAAPRGPDGRFIGAETYTLLNVEFEQAFTQTWSFVVFADALGEAAELGDYPFDERLYSVGLGVRYQTIVGPVRLEYGRNLNPRPGDPSGTLHFSVGFPF